VAVLAGEVLLARSGGGVAPDPGSLDGRVGGGGAPLRMVWLGDSTAAGIGATSPDRTVALRVAASLGRAVDLTVLARSGARVEDVVRHQVPAVAASRPDVVLVSVGANDVTHLTSTRSFRRRYARLLRGLPSTAEVVLLGVPDMGSPPRLAQPLRAVAGWRGRRLDREVRSAAAAAGASYVDIAGRTGPLFRSDPDRYFSADRYHPSDEGQMVWANAVAAVLRGDRIGA
jgi:lysophospholipase L1-like esterase